MTITVNLNGTDENPFHKLGLSQNPFPQVATHGMTSHVVHLQALGADPIPDTDYIRKHLDGRCSQELIDLCCKNFVKGKMVTFDITFPD